MALQEILKRLPCLQASMQDKGIQFEDAQDIFIFGYGSLPDYPHYPPTRIEKAYLSGYYREMCCQCLSTGTWDFPGLTLGLRPSETAVVPGFALVYSDFSNEEKEKMLEAFAVREAVDSLPIYTFEIENIVLQSGKTVPAIVCIADVEQRGYVGDLLTPIERKTLTAAEQEHVKYVKQSKIIALANGVSRRTGAVITCKSYFDRFLRLPLEDEGACSADTLLSEDERKALQRERKRVMALADLIDKERSHLRETQPKLVDMLEAEEAVIFSQWNALKENAGEAL